MPTKLSVETFISVLRKSGLVENERLQNVLSEFEVSADNDTPIALADRLVSANLLTKWQTEKLLQGKHRGYFLGKYKLLSLLGKGGMSSVYLAEHLLMRRRCALKVLPAKRVDDSSYLERFHREAQAAASLDHPNIVRAYDVDHQADGDKQIHFLVMEYVEGTSLQDLVPAKGLESFLDAAEYARQAAFGLQHAHKNGMVHRDIKPGNLLIDPTGIVKILDLGLARFFTVDEGQDALTIRHDEKVLGTADYLAPEQALDSHSVDARADIYALGCTLYFMVAGQPPFTEGTLAQRLLAHQVKTPTAIETVRRDIPRTLTVIIRKMMEKNPDDRYATSGDLEQALFTWIDQNADPDWRKAHSGTYGSRAADSSIAAGSVPVAKPISFITERESSASNTKAPVLPTKLENPIEAKSELPLSVDTSVNQAPPNRYFSKFGQQTNEASSAAPSVNPPFPVFSEEFSSKIAEAPAAKESPDTNYPNFGESKISEIAFPKSKSKPKVNSKETTSTTNARLSARPGISIRMIGGIVGVAIAVLLFGFFLFNMNGPSKSRYDKPNKP